MNENIYKVFLLYALALLFSITFLIYLYWKLIQLGVINV